MTEEANKVQTVAKEVWFELTTEEVVTRAQRVAEIRKEVDKVEEEKKKATGGFKAQINVLESEQDRLLQTIRANGENRTVECEVERDFYANKVLYKHGGKVVEERAMNFEERQMEMHAVDDPDMEEAVDEVADVIPMNQEPAAPEATPQ